MWYGSFTTQPLLHQCFAPWIQQYMATSHFIKCWCWFIKIDTKGGKKFFVAAYDVFEFVLGKNWTQNIVARCPMLFSRGLRFYKSKQFKTTSLLSATSWDWSFANAERNGPLCNALMPPANATTPISTINQQKCCPNQSPSPPLPGGEMNLIINMGGRQ